MLQNSALVGNLNSQEVRGLVKDDSKGNVGMTAALASVGLANGSS